MPQELDIDLLRLEYGQKTKAELTSFLNMHNPSMVTTNFTKNMLAVRAIEVVVEQHALLSSIGEVPAGQLVQQICCSDRALHWANSRREGCIQMLEQSGYSRSTTKQLTLWELVNKAVKIELETHAANNIPPSPPSTSDQVAYIRPRASEIQSLEPEVNVRFLAPASDPPTTSATDQSNESAQGNVSTSESTTSPSRSPRSSASPALSTAVSPTTSRSVGRTPPSITLSGSTDPLNVTRTPSPVIIHSPLPTGDHPVPPSQSNLTNSPCPPSPPGRLRSSNAPSQSSPRNSSSPSILPIAPYPIFRSGSEPVSETPSQDAPIVPDSSIPTSQLLVLTVEARPIASSGDVMTASLSSDLDHAPLSSQEASSSSLAVELDTREAGALPQLTESSATQSMTTSGSVSDILADASDESHRNSNPQGLLFSTSDAFRPTVEEMPANCPVLDPQAQSAPSSVASSSFNHFSTTASSRTSTSPKELAETSNALSTREQPRSSSTAPLGNQSSRPGSQPQRSRNHVIMSNSQPRKNSPGSRPEFGRGLSSSRWAHTPITAGLRPSGLSMPSPRINASEMQNVDRPPRGPRPSNSLPRESRSPDTFQPSFDMSYRRARTIKNHQNTQVDDPEPGRSPINRSSSVTNETEITYSRLVADRIMHGSSAHQTQHHSMQASQTVCLDCCWSRLVARQRARQSSK